jgi:hypothetical protein
MWDKTLGEKPAKWKNPASHQSHALSSLPCRTTNPTRYPASHAAPPIPRAIQPPLGGAGPGAHAPLTCRQPLPRLPHRLRHKGLLVSPVTRVSLSPSMSPSLSPSMSPSSSPRPRPFPPASASSCAFSSHAEACAEPAGTARVMPRAWRQVACQPGRPFRAGSEAWRAGPTLSWHASQAGPSEPASPRQLAARP